MIVRSPGEGNSLSGKIYDASIVLLIYVPRIDPSRAQCRVRAALITRGVE